MTQVMFISNANVNLAFACSDSIDRFQFLHFCIIEEINEKSSNALKEKRVENSNLNDENLALLLLLANASTVEKSCLFDRIFFSFDTIITTNIENKFAEIEYIFSYSLEATQADNLVGMV